MIKSKNHSNSSDADLILLYKELGSLEVLGKLYSRYTSLVYGVCLKYLKDRDEAKDMVMNLFEKLVSTVMSHEIVNFKSWLYVSARNQCLMHLRANKGKFKQEISADLMESNLMLHQEEEIETEQNLSKLEACIDKLTGEQKQCVQLFYLQEKCYKEITSLTGFELNHVKSYIQNGKRNLKICMENHV